MTGQWQQSAAVRSRLGSCFRLKRCDPGRARWLFLLACCLPALSAASGLRVATYNLRNYLVTDRMVAGQWRPDYPKPEAEKAAVRAVIRRVAPDILVLQEMGPADFLDELQADLQLEGLNYPHAIHLRAEDAARHVAILSRQAPIEVHRHTDMDFKYYETRLRVKRGLIEAIYTLPDGSPFRLFGVHLKSRWSEEPRDPESAMRRTREAAACRDRMIERTLEAGHTRYLVAGDFNDHPASSTLRRFYRRGDLLLGELLPAADSRGHVWTHFYAKEATYTQVDGFVLSPALLPFVSGGTGRIAEGPEVLVGSDHRMVYFDMEVSGSALEVGQAE